MNKNIVGVIIIIVAVAAFCIGGFIFLGNKRDSNFVPSSSLPTNGDKILVVYFSATNNTKSVAERIAVNLNSDIFEIVPKNEYTTEDLNYNDPSSRVSKEHDDESLRNIELTTTVVPDWDSYDVVLIGYPIWWGVAAWPVDSFVRDNNFEGKTVIPFCTSVSSGIGQSGELLESITTGGNWLDGYRFSSYATDDEIRTFINIVNNI